MVEIRHITLDDAPAFLDLCLSLDHETAFMMFEPGERTTTLDEQREAIARILAAANSTIIVAEDAGKLVGHVSAYGGEFNRIRHSAYIVVGVRQAAAGQGIGTRLFTELDAWAAENDVLRLELTVRVDNQHAIRLYQRMGFEIEGTKRKALLVDGVLIDELYMARLIARPSGE